MTFDFDVFVSYNSDDHDAVLTVAQQLKSRGLRVWFDEWELRPGLNWVSALDQALERCEAVAVFLSGSGVGPWQDAEIFGALEDHAKRELPVIPVILPGSKRENIEGNIPRFLRRYTAVTFTEGLADRRALERLQWGITGQAPTPEVQGPLPQAHRPTGGTQSAEAALDQLRSTLSSDSVTFFVGSNAAPEGGPSRAQIARQLLKELEADDGGTMKQGNGDEGFLPRLTTIGDYFAVKETNRGLENRVTRLIGHARRVPSSLALLAELMSELGRRSRRRRRFEARQLIVTTNLDLMIERALLLSGVPFTRLVQHRVGSRLTVHAYDRVLVSSDRLEVEDLDGDRQTADPGDVEALVELIETFGSVPTHGDLGAILDHRSSDGDRVRPILYKFRGSSDVPDSCAISTDHFIKVASTARTPNAVPVQITETIASTPMLFFGYGPLDPELRLMVHTLLSEALSQADDPRDKFVLKRPAEAGVGFDYLEAQIWEKVKLFCTKAGISIVEEHAADFLARLVEMVRKDMA